MQNEKYYLWKVSLNTWKVRFIQASENLENPEKLKTPVQVEETFGGHTLVSYYTMGHLGCQLVITKMTAIPLKIETYTQN